MQLAEFFWQLQAQFSEGDPIRVALLAAQASKHAARRLPLEHRQYNENAEALEKLACEVCFTVACPSRMLHLPLRAALESAVKRCTVACPSRTLHLPLHRSGYGIVTGDGQLPGGVGRCDHPRAPQRRVALDDHAHCHGGRAQGMAPRPLARVTYVTYRGVRPVHAY